MRYTFECEACHELMEQVSPISIGPPAEVRCWHCNMGFMKRVWNAPHIICPGDPDHIPYDKRVTQATSYGHSKEDGIAKERAYATAINERRKILRDQVASDSTWRHTHSVPAELYHGKIRETGDNSYWKDPANLARHTSCKVS